MMALSGSRQLALFFGPAPAPASSRHEFVLDGGPVTYIIKRSARRRSITLTVDADGLRVGAPWRASQRRIETLLIEHERWIVRKLAEWRERRPPALAWKSGARVMVLGEGVILECDPARAAIERTDGRLVLPLDPMVQPGTLRAHVLAWLRGAALACFEQRVAHYAPTLAVCVPSIRLSNAKTRWGTCHPDGRVRLNWRLIQMPLTLLDYVVVHELAHLRHPNHSQHFWREVERVLPDYAQRRCALRRDGHHYLVA